MWFFLIPVIILAGATSVGIAVELGEDHGAPAQAAPPAAGRATPTPTEGTPAKSPSTEPGHPNTDSNRSR